MPICRTGADQFLFDHVRRHREVARPRIGGTAFHFAALHGDVDVAAVGIAEDDLDLGADDIVEHRRHLDRDRSGLGRANRGFARHQVGEGLGG
jgi:hypothetical protein